MAAEVIAERWAHLSDKKDLLNAILKGQDPKTSETLTEWSVTNAMITFLMSGKLLFLSSGLQRTSIDLSRWVMKRR